MNFDAPAVLRKWPSLKDERVSDGCPYLVSDGTLDECIRQLMSKPASKRHLYEIHTAPQGELISAVLTTDQFSNSFSLAQELEVFERTMFLDTPVSCSRQTQRTRSIIDKKQGAIVAGK